MFAVGVGNARNESTLQAIAGDTGYVSDAVDYIGMSGRCSFTRRVCRTTSVFCRLSHATIGGHSLE